jgi:lipid intermediate transporter
VEKSFTAFSNAAPVSTLTDAPILLQYVFFLTLNTLATLAHHVTVRLLVRLFPPTATSRAEVDFTGAEASNKQSAEDKNDGTGSSHAANLKRRVGPGLASPSAISTALLVSSCTKLFPLLLVIWPESSSDDTRDTGLTQSFTSRARSYVGWAVLLNNIEALLILLDCGYIRAAGLAVAGATARWVVETVVLAAAGLEGDIGPVGDVSAMLKSAVNIFPTGKI